MKKFDKVGIFLIGLGVFGRTLLEWLRFFGVNPRMTQYRDWDFDWDKDVADAKAIADAMKEISLNARGNLALGRPVKASSTLENAKWSLSKLTDGDRENLGGSEVCG